MKQNQKMQSKVSIKSELFPSKISLFIAQKTILKLVVEPNLDFLRYFAGSKV